MHRHSVGELWQLLSCCMCAFWYAGPWLLGFVLRSKCSQSIGRQEDGEPFPQADALPEDARCNQEGENTAAYVQKTTCLDTVASCC